MTNDGLFYVDIPLQLRIAQEFSSVPARQS